MVILAILTAIHGTGMSAPELPSDRLKRSLSRGDVDDMAAVAGRMSVRELTLAMEGPDRELALAATVAAAMAVEPWRLLGPLATRAAGADRPLAVAAAISAKRIVSVLDWRSMAEYEMSSGELSDLLQTWQALALSPARWPDVRVHALEITAHLASLVGRPTSAYDLAGIVADAEPEVRRAALELWPEPSGVLPLVARVLASDPDPTVALAAAQLLCRDISSRAAAKPILAAMRATQPDGLARLRELLRERANPEAAALESARCLAADPTRESQRALRALKARVPAALRRHVGDLKSKK